MTILRMLKLSVSFFVLLFISNLNAESIWKHELDIDSLIGYSYLKPASSDINTNNSVLNLPSHSFFEDFRFYFKLTNDNDFKLIVRPSWQVQHQNTDSTSQNKFDTKGKLDLSDAFIEKELSSKSKTTIGLQVYQWGPAEFFNPSNPIYKSIATQKNILYKDKGHVLLRFNYDPIENLNIIYISEFLSNNESTDLVDQGFKSKNIIKFETSQFLNNSYFGFVFGQTQDQPIFFGEYANFNLDDLVSIYFDMKHQKEIPFYGPSANAYNGYDMILRKTSTDELSTLADVGIRYQDEYDIRIEYLMQSYGFSSNEFSNAKASTQSISSNLADNYKRFYRTGLDLYGRNYLYSSCRIPNLDSKKQSTLFLRFLKSFMDQSQSFQFALEKNISDSVVFNSELNYNNGDRDSELRLAGEYTVFFGIKFSKTALF